MPAASPRAEPFLPAPSFDGQQQLLALSEQTCRMLAIAGVMVASGRAVELAGLKQNAGLLCAKALDLPPAEAGLVRAELIRIVAGLDELRARMTDLVS